SPVPARWHRRVSPPPPRALGACPPGPVLPPRTPARAARAPPPGPAGRAVRPAASPAPRRGTAPSDASPRRDAAARRPVSFADAVGITEDDGTGDLRLLVLLRAHEQTEERRPQHAVRHERD